MAPIDPANTARLYVDYTANGIQHSVILRPQTGVSVATLRDWFNGWLTDNADLFRSTTVFQSARTSDQNTDVTNPIDWTPVAGAGGAGGSTDEVPRFFSFVGRDAFGHRMKLSFYGGVFGDDANFRVTSGEAASVAAAVTDLNDLQAKLGSITGAKGTWKPYANLGYNAYWQRERRRSA